MARKSAQDVLTSWAQGLSNKTQNIKDGINAVRTAPGVAAAAAKERMRAGLNAAIDSGKWEAAVSSVSLSDWQTKTLAKVGNIATGANLAAKDPKVLATFQQNLADNDAALAAIAGMPSDTIDQRIQRSMAYQQARYQLASGRNR